MKFYLNLTRKLPQLTNSQFDAFRISLVLFLVIMAYRTYAANYTCGLSPATANKTDEQLVPSPVIHEQEHEITDIPHTMQARVDGDSLYVAFVDDNGYEICYWFCPTMANKLFTFHRVGYRATTSSIPNANDINESSGITWLNRTASDNIGPVNMRNGGWVGGNHLVNDTRTAITRSVATYADGTNITAEDGTVDAHVVAVDVINDILDPASPVTDNGTFSSTMFTEAVHYEVYRNSIDVTVTHTYSPGVSNYIYTYYGMQSMFNGEDKIMPPHGPYNDFTPTGQVAPFQFGDYPNFCRFIETKSSHGWCQATHLLPDGIGDHRHLRSNHDIFITSTYGKYYHLLIRNLTVTDGTTYSWRGVYSWFYPLVNDDNILVYSAVLNNKEVIFVDTKQACDITFSLPTSWAANAKKVDVLQADDGLSLDVNNPLNLHLSATCAGTAILTYNAIGDVNGDGVVSGADVTALYNKLLSDIEPNGNADVNGDGVVSGADVTALYNSLLGN